VFIKVDGTSFTPMFAANDWEPNFSLVLKKSLQIQFLHDTFSLHSDNLIYDRCGLRANVYVLISAAALGPRVDIIVTLLFFKSRFVFKNTYF
jgi:hypothetical protein